MHVVFEKQLNSDAQILCTAIEHVPTFRAVLGDEVEVISRDAEGTRIAWRPYAYECALDIFEAEFRLSLGCGEKPCAFVGSFHCACIYPFENTIHAQRIKQIFGFPVRIAGSF